MRKRVAAVLFVAAAAAAWIGAYVPGIVRHHKVIDALDAPHSRWICVINGDAVSTQLQGYANKKYILLGGERFYSDEFRKWGRSADHMLVVIDDNQRILWDRLDLSETEYYARRYGIAQAGCRRMAPGERATNVVAPISPPLHDGIYQGPGSYGGETGSTVVAPPARTPNTNGSFDWKKAVGPALGKQGSGSDSSGSGTGGAAPATDPVTGGSGASSGSGTPSDGGVR